MKYTLYLLFNILSIAAFSQNVLHNPGANHANKFEQIAPVLPTPNEYRTASGTPGNKYWQQQCDYDIKCSLDEERLILSGTEKVTYHNNSPDVLKYLWLQLDENQHSSINNANYQLSQSINDVSPETLNDLLEKDSDNGYGVTITALTDASGKKLMYTINKTMMRIDLPKPLQPGEKFIFTCKWNYKIPNRMTMGGRGGYEMFKEDGNALFTITQWYPRLAVYNDVRGWQNTQFTGRAEFALTFGNFNVEIDVPADHIVGATGECKNYEQVLTAKQLSRLNKAKSAVEPVEIVTLSEAIDAEKTKKNQRKKWVFKAENVRDFAWTASRKFVWDAMEIDVEKNKVLCMSFYPKEAYGLYRKYSTKTVAHTIRTYSEFTIPYPYPVAQSVEAANGMEYPMICFNYGRTEKDGTYTEATKNGMISVIIHEVGHNFFPMIVNSDERQWTWMDEGLNTFVQYLTEEKFDNRFPTKRGPAWTIVDYMRLPKDQLEPIMTNSDNIIHFGPNAYAKPATGLNILRETIMGRKLFDYAFKEYAKRWAFKHPEPADFFRTMEDASAEDLDWFWRGWFYSTDPVDIAVDSVRYFVYDPSMPYPSIPSTIQTKIDSPLISTFDDISKIRNREDSSIQFLTDSDTTLRDFYWRYGRGLVPYDPAVQKIANPAANIETLSKEEQKKYQDLHVYEVHFSNKGGMVMPIIIEFTYEDGTRKLEKIPAQIWRKNENNVVKLFVSNKPVKSIQLDPLKETADIDESNNHWPVTLRPSKFQLFKSKQTPRGQSDGNNPMQHYKEKNQN